MFGVLIDTSVWLDIAQDKRQVPLLDAIASLQKDGRLQLLVPHLVLGEFRKNRQRVADRAQRSLSTHFNLVKEAIRRANGTSKERDKVLQYLSDVDHRIPLVGETAEGELTRIDQLLSAGTLIDTSDRAKLRATDRALQRLAPCHHDNKNAMADAVLIETHFECVSRGKPGDRFAFVTHNKHDFSDMNANQKLPHRDLAGGFSRIKSLYFVSLVDCMRRIDPTLAQDVMWESTYFEEVRSLSEILEAIDQLTTQVWYNRHKNLAWEIQHGRHKLVTREEWDVKWQKVKGYGQTNTIDSVWEGALKAGRRAERTLGKGNCGPWTDFEWGMINGKLSALRWALGSEWDMLDT